MPADINSFDALAGRMPDAALASQDGLVAHGGDLEPQTLLCAYSRGLFPWFNAGQPILWWSPDPRCLLKPDDFHLSRTTCRKLRRLPFELTINRDFAAVMRACAAPRQGQPGTWITAAMMDAYGRLHNLGYAHSVEAWHGGSLAGGLYGIAMGRAFFGESMFHLAPEASRAALSALVALLKNLQFLFIDCQQETPHMLRMGAASVPRLRFLAMLREALARRDYHPGSGEICPWRPWFGLGSIGLLGEKWRQIIH